MKVFKIESGFFLIVCPYNNPYLQIPSIVLQRFHVSEGFFKTLKFGKVICRNGLNSVKEMIEMTSSCKLMKEAMNDNGFLDHHKRIIWSTHS